MFDNRRLRDDDFINQLYEEEARASLIEEDYVPAKYSKLKGKPANKITQPGNTNYNTNINTNDNTKKNMPRSSQGANTIGIVLIILGIIFTNLLLVLIGVFALIGANSRKK